MSRKYKDNECSIKVKYGLSKKELNMVANAVVVKGGPFYYSCQITLQSGQVKYIPMTQSSCVIEGDFVDLSRAWIFNQVVPRESTAIMIEYHSRDPWMCIAEDEQNDI